MSQGERELPFGETPDAVTFCEFTSALYETWLNLAATKDPDDLTPFLEIYLPIMERVPSMATLAQSIDMDKRLGGKSAASKVETFAELADLVRDYAHDHLPSRVELSATLHLMRQTAHNPDDEVQSLAPASGSDGGRGSVVCASVKREY